MPSPEHHKGFAERLGHLLKRFCPATLLNVLSDQLEHLQTLESELMEKATGDVGEVGAALSVVETGSLENIITSCEQGLDTRDFLDLLVQLGDLCISFGEYPTAKAILVKVMEAAGSDRRFTSAAGFAYSKRAEIRIRQAHWNGALKDLKRASVLFKKSKNVEGLATVDNSLGVLASERGDGKKAAAHFKKAQSGFERAGNAERSNTALMNLGILATISGRWDEGVAYYQRILPQFEKLGQVSRLVEVHHNIGMLLLAKGELHDALSQFDESLRRSGPLHYRTFTGLAYLGKASACAKLADHPLAMVFVQKALDIFRQLNDQLGIADAYRVKGIILRELGHPQLAELCLFTSLRLNEEHHSLLNLGETYAELGRLYKRMNLDAKAAKASTKAVAFLKKAGAERDARQARQMLTS